MDGSTGEKREGGEKKMDGWMRTMNLGDLVNKDLARFRFKHITQTGLAQSLIPMRMFESCAEWQYGIGVYWCIGTASLLVCESASLRVCDCLRL